MDIGYACIYKGKIIAVCGTDNVEFVQELGATEVVDYQRITLKAWAEELKNKVDLVVDCKSLEEA